MNGLICPRCQMSIDVFEGYTTWRTVQFVTTGAGNPEHPVLVETTEAETLCRSCWTEIGWSSR